MLFQNNKRVIKSIQKGITFQYSSNICINHYTKVRLFLISNRTKCAFIESGAENFPFTQKSSNLICEICLETSINFCKIVMLVIKT